MASMLNRMRILGNVRQVAQRRCMSAGQSIEAAEADTKQWINISMGALVSVGVCTAWVMYVESQHEHHHSQSRSYMKIRTKSYPWQCSDCNFFDSKCFAECKAKKQ